MQAQNYIWKGNQLYFRKMTVPKPKQNNNIILEMHQEIWYFGEQRTLIEICNRLYQHNCMEQVKEMVKACKEFQMVKCIGNIRSHVEDSKNILYVTCSTKLHWTLLNHFQKQKGAISTFWLLLTIIPSDLKRKQYLTTLLLLLLLFLRKRLFADMVSLSMSSLQWRKMVY